MRKRSAGVFAGAVAAGAVIGWSSVRPAAPVAPAPRTAAPSREVAREKWGKEDFVKAIRERAAVPDFNPLARELADWTDEELKAALEASLVNPDCRIPGDPAARLPGLLLAEWLRRDFSTALAWVEKLEPGKPKEMMTQALAIHWPRERGDEGFEYLLANRERLSKVSVLLVMNALQGRLNQGAAATVEFMRRLREEDMEFPGAINGGTFPNGIQYPPGFDFPALIGSEEFARLKVAEEFGGIGAADSILLEWQVQDREAAYDWLMAKFGVEGLGKIALNHKVDQKENLAWAAGKVEAMDESGRSEFVGTVLEKWAWSPYYLQHFAAGVRDPALRDEVHRVGVRSLFAGVKYGTIPLLEEIEPARRLELLEKAEPGETFSGKNRYHRQFTSTDESLLRRKLAEWQAGEEQVEKIVSRFKP